jgi:hypothetical protein
MLKTLQSIKVILLRKTKINHFLHQVSLYFLLDVSAGRIVIALVGKSGVSPVDIIPP